MERLWSQLALRREAGTFGAVVVDVAGSRRALVLAVLRHQNQRAATPEEAAEAASAGVAELEHNGLGCAQPGAPRADSRKLDSALVAIGQRLDEAERDVGAAFLTETTCSLRMQLG